eukprot:6182665-Pleurochrysis_carterae.AAC.1
MEGRGNDTSALRPKGQDFNEHLAYFIQSAAMVPEHLFWPVLAEVYEHEQYLEHGSELDPTLTWLNMYPAV